MRQRVAVLLGLLLIRLMVGGWTTAACATGQQVRLAGKISQVDHKGTKQLIRLQQFWWESEEKNNYFRGQRVAVIGRCRRTVIDFLLSRIRLTDPKITTLSFETVAENEWWRNGGVVREKLVANYQRWLPEPEASLVAGIVLGSKQSLPAKFYQKLIDTGTVHVVVASGYNLTVVAEMVFYALIYVVNRKKAAVGVVVAMLGYAWLTGWEVPVMRALVMGSLVLWSKATGRTNQTGWWLLVAVWMMLVWQPALLINVSFQLSVMATAGLVWIEPGLRLRGSTLVPARFRTLLKFIGNTELAPTLAAQIATAPIIWWHFGRISWIAPLVNVLVLPLVPPTMLLGVLALGVGGIAMVPLYGLVHLIVVIINIFGS